MCRFNAGKKRYSDVRLAGEFTSSWTARLDFMAKKAQSIPGVKTAIEHPEELSNKHPTLRIFWDPAKFHVTGYEVAEELGSTRPRVAIGSRDESDGGTSIDIVSSHMQEGEEKIVADRVFEVLSRKRSPKSDVMAAPAVNLSGLWDVDVKFFSSIIRHTINIQQDGNWINGTHKSQFDERNIAGTLEANQLKLSSTMQRPGDRITFYFSGTVSADKMSGNIHMGEYRTAEFTAVKNTTKPARKKVLVPKGPPLAT